MCSCNGPSVYDTCAAEEGITEVLQSERGNSAQDDRDEPSGARHETRVFQSHVTELERVHDGHESLHRHDGQHEDGHFAGREQIIPSITRTDTSLEKHLTDCIQT